MFVPVRSLQFASNLQRFHNLHRVITSENSRLYLCFFVLPGLPRLQCRPRNQINEMRVRELCLGFNAQIVCAVYMMTLETECSKLMTVTNVGLEFMAIHQTKS
jgi:hypothetical protein